MSAECLSTYPEKIKAMKGYPKPSSRKEVMPFLGHVGYHRNFVQGFAKIAGSLTYSLKDRTPLYWTPEMDHAFHQLTTALCTASILAHPDFSMPFKITTDASEVGLRVVLVTKGLNEKLSSSLPAKDCLHLNLVL
jgi:hypothetical protein